MGPSSLRCLNLSYMSVELDASARDIDFVLVSSGWVTEDARESATIDRRDAPAINLAWPLYHKAVLKVRSLNYVVGCVHAVPLTFELIDICFFITLTFLKLVWKCIYSSTIAHK